MSLLKLLGVVFTLSLVTSLSPAREPMMLDDRAAEVTVSRMLFAIDRLDWSAVRAALADEVEIDYTSLFGGTAERLAADTLVQRWQSLLPGFDATQHLTGPIILTASEGSRATAETHVRGYHYVEADVWMVAGHYVMRLERATAGWKISGIRLDTYRQEGNKNLPAVAIENVKKGRVRTQR